MTKETLSIIVAGGAGFLGSHLCETLLDQGHRVLCVDNLQTGCFENIMGFMNSPKFEFIKQDIIKPLRISGPVDQIYNLACPASPPKYELDPIHTFKTCIMGSMNLLDLAREKGARVLQASTSEVYGDPTISPQPESYHGNVNTFGPRSCYDEGKRAAETLFHDYRECHGVSIKIARIFNTYGPRMCADDGRVVSNFIVQALLGEDITIYGEGLQTRSFCYVDDLVRGLVLLMNSSDEVDAPVNLGNPGEFTMIELAELILEKTQSNSTLSFHDLPTDDPRQRKPQITSAQTLLGWEPTIALREGLDYSIAFYAEQLAHAGKHISRRA